MVLDGTFPCEVNHPQEPWKFIVVQDMDLRDKLKEFAWGAQTHLLTASHFVLLLARKSLHTKASSDYIKYMARDVQSLPASKASPVFLLPNID